MNLLLVQSDGEIYQKVGDLSKEDLQEIADGNLRAFELRSLEGRFYEAEVELVEAEKEDEEDDLDLNWLRVDTI